MNINQFQTLNSNVLSVEPTNTGIAIWVKYEGGREGSYRVNDPSFSAREGHQLTAIMCGIHPIAIINRNTNIKIQLLNGYDLLGTGPEVKSRSLMFWLGWAIFLVPFSMCIGGAIIDSPHQFFGASGFAPYIANLAGGTIALGVLFGVPFWTIIRPRVNRYKHTLRVRQADAAIAQLFNPL